MSPSPTRMLRATPGPIHTESAAMAGSWVAITVRFPPKTGS